jgi:DNA end-binding protein Ku
MPARPSWEGFLKFNLLSVPVKGYNAAAGGVGKIGFNLLHKKCHSRIRYKKVCPVHGEVEQDEIVSGFEVAKGQYVVVGKEERGELRDEDDKAINVDTFVAAEAIDPVYYSGRTYYLVPSGKVAQKPYAVLLDAMRAQDRCAVAQVVFAGRGRVALVHPAGQLLAMTLLHFESELRKPTAFEEDLEKPAVSAEERKLAEMLIKAASTEELDLEQYKDEYAGKLAKLIEGKSKRKLRVSAADTEEPAIINLMDALRQSLDNTQKGKTGKGSKKARSRSQKGSRSPSKRKTA